MDEDEPAWKAGLYEAVEERFPLIRNAVTRCVIREFVAEHIKAAEERGRREALNALKGEIEALKATLPDLAVRSGWRHGYEGALTQLAFWAEHAPPESP